MHIGGPKRTTRLDDAKEVLVTHAADGTPIWTTVGDKRMSADNKAELSDNLRKRALYNAAIGVMQKVQAGAAGFFESVVMNAAPPHVLDAYQQGDTAPLAEWLPHSGFTFKQDGLRSIVLHQGSVMADFTATVPAAVEQQVLALLRMDEGVSAIEQAARKAA